MNRSFLLFLLPVLVLSVNPRLKDNYLEVQCPTSSPTSSQFFIHQSVTPQGNLSAGQYEKISVRTLLECTKACCVKESCDVVFFFDLSCFHIHCKSSELCKPLVRTGEKFKHSYMIQVKDADLRNYSDTLTQKSSELQPKELMSQLDDKRLLETGKNESDHYETPLVAETASSKSSVKPTLIKTCIYGIGENCAINEHCVVHNNRARQGFCECSDGYTRSELTGECQLLTTKNGSNVTATPSLLPTNSTSIKPTATPSPEYENKATGDKKSSSTSTPFERHLVVSAGGNKVIQLPDNEVTLSAYALPQENTGEKYSYLWTLLSQPGGDEEAGIMQGQTSPTLKLSKLRSGVYMFEISVTGNGSSGKDTVNVTVLPPKRTNKPPVAIIQPSNVTVKLPNKDTVLDGSYSTDDDKIVEYHWEVISLPIGCKIQLNNSSTVQLKNLIPGFYRFKLTVKDSDGILNYTFANVTVLKEKDYPPTANAGSDAVIYLPQDDLTLNGNLSSDDKGIKSYQWVKSPETDKSVDMEGTNTPYLHLSHLEVGVYKFILKVTDTSDQMSEAEVHVFVKPESNVPPKAVAGEDINVSLPLDKPVTLDGQKSSDGIKIMKWDWKQVDGPKPATMENDNTSTAQVSHLVPGEYVFRLTVCDDKGQNTSDEIKVIVTQRKNTPPRANAGGDKTINLPCGLVVLNGSKSWDDVEIISFRWTRDPSSLAAGDIIEKSDHSSLLKLINVIPGRYLFHLTVTDEQGVSSSDSASLIVKNPLTLLDQVELVLNADIKSFTAEQEDTLMKQLELLLHSLGECKIRVLSLDADRQTRRVRLTFIAEKTQPGGTVTPVKGVDVVAALRKKLLTDSSLLNFYILTLDTVVCQNECSNHGSCDPYTKLCVCEAFWMQDIFQFYFGHQESNCDWSILYVVIIAFLGVMAVAGSIWGIIFLCMRVKCRKQKKRHRYALLEDSSDKDGIPLISRGKSQNSSLMVSDSESDTLYDSRRRSGWKKNGKPLNGVIRNEKKFKA